MTTTKQRSACIAGFLNTAHDILRDDESGRERIKAQMSRNRGEPEPERENARREALARWSTHHWAPITLRLAGYDELADIIAGADDARAAAEILRSPHVTAPAAPWRAPRDQTEIAGAVCEYAAHAGQYATNSLANAMAAKMACEATRRAQEAGRDTIRLDAAEEMVTAARAAMEGRGP